MSFKIVLDFKLATWSDGYHAKDNDFHIMVNDVLTVIKR